MSVLDQIPDVDIEEGLFKYIQIRLTLPTNNGVFQKVIIRGYDLKWHNDILSKVKESLSAVNPNIMAKALGGGRIRHEPSSGTIFIYGYSQAFGRADHTRTVAMVKSAYPSYQNISFSNDGY